MEKKFYMRRNGGMCNDILLENATDWESAIINVKASVNYVTTKLSKAKRNKFGLDDYIEVYCGKLRSELTFEDLRNPEVYRKVY